MTSTQQVRIIGSVSGAIQLCCLQMLTCVSEASGAPASLFLTGMSVTCQDKPQFSV